MSELDDLQKQVWDNMVAKGFDTTDPQQKIDRVIGELNELREAIESGHSAHIAEEMADVIIESLGLSAVLGVNIGEAVPAKIEVNAARRYKDVNGELVKEVK